MLLPHNDGQHAGRCPDRTQLTQARVYTDQKEYAKALEIYKKLYEQMPDDEDVYSEYLECAARPERLSSKPKSWWTAGSA